MALIYSRVTPFGFVDPDNATDEDRYYGEEVTLEDETGVLEAAELLRGLYASSGALQTTGGSSQEQAEEMAALLRGVGE